MKRSSHSDYDAVPATISDDTIQLAPAIAVPTATNLGEEDFDEWDDNHEEGSQYVDPHTWEDTYFKDTQGVTAVFDHVGIDELRLPDLHCVSFTLAFCAFVGGMPAVAMWANGSISILPFILCLLIIIAAGTGYLSKGLSLLRCSTKRIPHTAMTRSGTIRHELAPHNWSSTKRACTIQIPFADIQNVDIKPYDGIWPSNNLLEVVITPSSVDETRYICSGIPEVGTFAKISDTEFANGTITTTETCRLSIIGLTDPYRFKRIIMARIPSKQETEADRMLEHADNISSNDDT
mmetsp:Transcript_14374/g.23723  ORF Transcript_14374/g.23723 Transcript_14374/m.23723 type:complete len:292 (-) Transcript_14374:157-1032(-)|eukprot:CAMPEP_0119004710 /NCGR_PEP_ID=MMETSP1176-20130426/1304_1 /TAXON_ID=265551 /ORGANISM="Synedropsis recta cf, Strain CCMP1620" /LENGTH=291 /DNA_ID=CAMNT_0006956449 /DNA_START=76 /DNA_END=951 /DNA_ORIENTATION=+